MKVLVVGGNGGIGWAMTQEVAKRFPIAEIHATYHRNKPEANITGVAWHKMDATDELQVKALSEAIGDVGWVINCVGMLHNEEKGPEKSVSALDADFFLQTVSVNTLPTLLLAKYFTPALKRSHAPKFATISAKVGSISDNQLGGWYSYRASKAALNMCLKTLAIEWQRCVKHGVVLALHPGTTDTPLSKPFQANVPSDKLFTPACVASDLISLIEKATPHESGAFLAYDGEQLPW